MLSSAGRAQDRVEARRVSLVNAGALCVLAFFTVFRFDLDLKSSAMAALMIGLMGTKALQMAERYWLVRFPSVALVGEGLDDDQVAMKAAILKLQEQLREEFRGGPNDERK